MHVLITYDVSTISRAGQRRLRKIAKTCLDYGQRVQNSVFECEVDPAQYVDLQHKIKAIMSEDEDSVRFYNLGNNWQTRVDHFGLKEPLDTDGLLIV